MQHEGVMDQSEIKTLIPHREPFLWLDEVIEIVDDTIRARKSITADLPLFQGHYPDFPVLPGVIQCEAAFQAAAVLIAKTRTLEEGKVPVVARLNNTKFKRLVRPGDEMHIEVELTEALRNAFFLTGKVTVDGSLATRCDFTCAFAPT